MIISNIVETFIVNCLKLLVSVSEICRTARSFSCLSYSRCKPNHSKITSTSALVKYHQFSRIIFCGSSLEKNMKLNKKNLQRKFHNLTNWSFALKILVNYWKGRAKQCAVNLFLKFYLPV